MSRRTPPPKSAFTRLAEDMAIFRRRRELAERRARKCPHCGRFLRYDAYYDKWRCVEGHI